MASGLPLATSSEPVRTRHGWVSTGLRPVAWAPISNRNASEVGRLERGSAEHQTYVWPGGQPAALLLHGFPGTPAEVRTLGQVLHEAGWTVQGLFLPGFGTQFDTLGEYRYSAWVASIAPGRALASSQSITRAPGRLQDGRGRGNRWPQPNARPDGLALLAPFSGGIGPMGAMFPLMRRLSRSSSPSACSNSTSPTRTCARAWPPSCPVWTWTTRRAAGDPGDHHTPVGLDEVRLAGQASRRAGLDPRAHVDDPGCAGQGRWPQASRQFLDPFSSPVRYREAPAPMICWTKTGRPGRRSGAVVDFAQGLARSSAGILRRSRLRMTRSTQVSCLGPAYLAAAAQCMTYGVRRLLIPTRDAASQLDED